MVGCGRLRAVNFIEEVLERFPASARAVIALDREGNLRVWHFGELIAISAGLSGAFAARGVRRGDAVMILIGNRIEWVLAMLACWRMGAIALPCNTQLRRNDLALRASVANPSLAVGEDELLAGLPDGIEAMSLADLHEAMDEDRPQQTPVEPADLDPGDGALIVFTSGTTGEPRGVLHTQAYLSGQRVQAEHWFGARNGEVAWCTTATGWSKSARNVFVAPWLMGATAVIQDARFDPEERLRLCEELGVNVLCQAPTEYRMLAKRTQLRPIDSLRQLVSAGEPLNPEIITTFRDATGLEIHDGYGQTETGQVTGMRAGEPVRPGSMGKPLPGFEVRVSPVAPGSTGASSGHRSPSAPWEEATDDVGELQLRPSSCPTFFARYLDGEPFDGDWWQTGDLVRADEDGFLYFEGRSDDLILSSGYRIGPFEVESALVAHPAVAEAAAVSAPDPERGAVVRAIVVLRDAEPSEQLA